MRAGAFDGGKAGRVGKKNGFDNGFLPKKKVLNWFFGGGF